MNARKILFPTDFSTASDAGLAQATSLARDTGARLVILHVEEPPVAYMGELYYGFPEPDRSALKAMLEQVIPRDPQVKFEHRLEVGDPAEKIVDVARDEGVDLIVMGTHGRTGLLRLLMGSIAETVVRKAPCAVFTFKHPPAAPVEESLPQAVPATQDR